VGIEWFRDLSIVILGFVTTAVLIFTAVLVYRLYRKITTTLFLVQTLMKSVNDTVNTVEEIIKTTSQNINDIVTEVKDSIKLVSKGIGDTIFQVQFQVQEGIKPLLPILAVIQGIRRGFESISKMFKKESNEEGGNSNE
jgi:methyl-accepting chemotaxis protein